MMEPFHSIIIQSGPGGFGSRAKAIDDFRREEVKPGQSEPGLGPGGFMEIIGAKPERRGFNMMNCVLCHREVRDSVDPQKIITCAQCVQILLAATREDKIAFRDKLLAQGKKEEARSVEAFIVPDVNGEVATFKRTLRHGRLKGVHARSKTVPVSPRLRTGGEDGKNGKE